MATESPEEGETRNGRLQVFLSSFWASIGGVFGGNYSNDHQESEFEQGFDFDMASRAVVPEQNRGTPITILMEICDDS